MFNVLAQNIAFGLYNLSWNLALPWLRLNRRLAEGFKQRTLNNPLPVANLWIQAASVGESYLALEIIRNLKVDKTVTILLTSNTRQGVDILSQALRDQKKRDKGIQLCAGYFPFDKPAIMERAIKKTCPDVMVLLETELWPGLLRALKKNNCKTFIINGRITDKSLKRYLWWPSLWQQFRPDKILAISPTDAERFGQLFGTAGVEVMHNIKFDRIAPSTISNGDKNTIKTLLPPDTPFLVLASVRREEESPVEKIIHEIIRRRPQTAIGLFPRHMHRLKFWQARLNQSGIRWSLRSTTGNSVSTGTVILWDTFGELLPAYQLAKSAFVGGSLAPLGGQNFLEALVSGVIPIIGPSWENFAWVGREIIDAGLLRVAGDWEEVAAHILKDMARTPSRENVIERARQFVKARQGGTEQACRHIAAGLQNI